jgi:hypothetical protein
MVVSLASGIGELVQILAQLTNPKVCSYASRRQTRQTYTLEINEKFSRRPLACECVCGMVALLGSPVLFRF